jgi:hypothetical protein
MVKDIVFVVVTRSSTPTIEGVDKRRRERVIVALVDDPIDDLANDEWCVLMAYRIDKSAMSSSSSSPSLFIAADLPSPSPSQTRRVVRFMIEISSS